MSSGSLLQILYLYLVPLPEYLGGSIYLTHTFIPQRRRKELEKPPLLHWGVLEAAFGCETCLSNSNRIVTLPL